MVRLQILTGPHAGQSVALPPGYYRVGSGPDNGIQIEGESVAEHHGEWEVGEDTLLVRDLGSAQGTCVDGALVETLAVLPGQRLRLGTVELLFTRPGPPVRVTGGRPGTIPQPSRSHPNAARRPTPAPGSFWQGIGESFAFPLRGKGPVLILGGAVFFVIVDLMQRYVLLLGFFIGLLSTAYLMAYLQSVVMASAQGEPEPPDWPDLADTWSDVLRPYLMWLAVLVVCLGPGVLVLGGTSNPLASSDAGSGEPSLLGIVLLGVGVFYLPMALLGVSLADSLGGLNPLVIIPSIARVFGAYCFTCLILFAALIAQWGITSLLDQLPIPIFVPLIAWLVSLYFLLMMMRLLGLLYFTAREKLRWFGER